MNTTIPDSVTSQPLSVIVQCIIAAVILIVLYLISLRNYLLFHGIVELAGIAVAFSIFIIVWNTRRDINDAFFLIVGISFLFIGSIDLIHTLAYKGMGVFPGNNSDLPTQLWIAARYFQSITFLVATLFIGRSITKDRKYDAGIVIAACTAACALIFASIFVWQNFPQCFIEGSGLTPFKIASEYIISLILIATIAILCMKREHFDPTVWKFLIAAQVFLVLGELAFTSYISVYGFMNMLGHLFRLVSVYFFYRAFVVVSLTHPYDLLLRKLKEDDYALNERFKEVNCLYAISALMERRGTPLHEILEKTVTLLPSALQYPEITEARIVVDGQTLQTAGFQETPWILAREIRITGNPVGQVEVCYLEERPAVHEGPFLKEERDLINAVAERMGHIIERMEAEDALRKSEKKYHTLFENMLEGLAYCKMIYDDKGEPVDWVYLMVNQAFEQMTGLKDVTGKRVLEAIPDIRELTPELFNTYGRVALTGIPETFDIDFKPLKMWLKVSAFSMEKGYFVAVFEDITKRRQAEEALHETNEYLRNLMDYANAPIIVWDPEFRITRFNHAFERLSGMTEQEVIGHHLAILFPETSRDASLNLIREKLAGVRWEVVEIPIKHISGQTRIVLWNSATIFADDGTTAIATIAQGQDITERKAAEEEVRRSRDFYLKILDDFPNPIWRADMNAKCDYFNRGWLAFTGRTLEQELGDGWSEGVNKDDLERCLKIYLDNFHARKPFEMEYRLRYHDGTYRWLYDSGKPFYNPDGEFAGYIGSCYDIQDRRQAEEALRQANNKLNLLSSITRHDINNQLMALNGYIALSEESIGNPVELKGFIAKEQKIADSIARQIAFTKDYESLGVKSPVWQDVDALVRDAGTAHPMRNIVLEDQCPGLEVFADPLLEKVFYNLIDNSLRYGGEKMTAIRVTVDEGSEALRIIYEDDGNGINADDKKKLFTKGFGRNTGLGLFLSREILSITGITITENGEPGKGARFEITVPKGAYRFSR